MAEPAPRQSLRTRLQRRVLIPLALTWLLGSAVAAGVAYAFTQQAFDRSLLDDAYALGAQVTESVDGEMALNLSPREVGTLLFDQSERVFFTVRRADGLLVAGHAGLASVPREAGEPWAFGNQHFKGLDLRAVTLQRTRQHEFVVTVAQTVHSRSLVLQRLLALAVVPQALLLLCLWLWLRRSIRDELQPLAELQQALQSRDSADLSPLAVAAPSRDVARLSQAASDLMARIAVGVQAQREFTGNVAHELRTPLAGIRALAEYGLARSEPAVWRDQLQQIQRSEQRASHLVDQLLALAMADESREGLQLKPLRLDLLVHDILLRTLPRADAEQVDLGAVGLDEPLWVRGDAALIEGLLGNLLDNALRHGRPAAADEPRRVTVELLASPTGAATATATAAAPAPPTARSTATASPAGAAPAEVLLAVTDNGPGLGVDIDHDPRVLARWERGPLADAEGRGAGLGLAIVARYASLLQARLQLLPAVPGPGLRACVWLRQSGDDEAGRAVPDRAA
jgi:two-component system sensor histidine kinase TctE